MIIVDFYIFALNQTSRFNDLESLQYTLILQRFEKKGNEQQYMNT
jgi:hypothetical protein